MHRIHPEIRLRAQEFRQPQTPSERMIWQLLRGRQVDGYKFRRQHPIGSFIVDFCCPAAKLVIEIDGETHTEQAEYDQARTDWLENEGYYVIRFSNQEVYQSPISVVEKNIKAMPIQSLRNPHDLQIPICSLFWQPRFLPGGADRQRA